MTPELAQKGWAAQVQFSFGRHPVCASGLPLLSVVVHSGENEKLVRVFLWASRSVSLMVNKH